MSRLDGEHARCSADWIEDRLVVGRLDDAQAGWWAG